MRILFRLPAVLLGLTLVLGSIPGRAEQATEPEVQEKTPKKGKKNRKSRDREIVGQTDDGREIVKRDDTVEHDSSEALRQGKKFSAVVESGFAVGGGGTSGGALGYYVKSNLLTEASHVSGSLKIAFISVKSSLAELRVKRFWGNSFYTNAGLGYRTIALNASLESISGNTDLDTSMTVRSFGGSFGIGNRWQWETFTLGCDWIGFFAPFSHTGDTNVKTNTEAERKELEKTAEQLGVRGSSQLLRFYLGVSI